MYMYAYARENGTVMLAQLRMTGFRFLQLRRL